MKKILLLTILFAVAISALAQNKTKTSAIGFLTTYDYYDNEHSNWYGDRNTKGFTYGLEYSETKGIWSYRAGLVYSKIKDQTFFDFDDGGIFLVIDIWFEPEPEPLRVIDFPISGQIHLPLGTPKVKLYGNLGLMTSLSIYDVEDPLWYYYGFEKIDTNKTLSFRGIYGGGIIYQFAKHFGIDLSVNRKENIHTIDNSIIKPRNSLSFSAKVDYYF